jgi:taurine transport system permease protein
VIAGILVIAFIALVLELVLRWVERRFASWAGR